MSTIRAIILGSLALASLTTVGCGAKRDLSYKTVEAEELQRQIKELEAQLAACESGKAETIIKSGDANGEPTGVIVEKVLGPKGVGISTREPETVLTIESSILFKPGSAALTSQAKGILARVATLLKEKYPNHYVRVEGHTDDEKISRSKDQWDDNWELSGYRGLVVLRYLKERGVSEKVLGYAGYAMQRPLSPNTNTANRSKNRRVEIVVIPK